YLLLQFGEVNQGLSRQGIHGTDQVGKAALHDKVLAFALERLDGARGSGQNAAEGPQDAAARQIGVLLGSRQRKLAADDALIEQKPGVVVSAGGDVLKGCERIEAREEGNRQAMASRIQPQR